MIKIAVLGDILIDKFVYGTTKTTDPTQREQGGLPFSVEREERLLGGAGNLLLRLLEIRDILSSAGEITLFTDTNPSYRDIIPRRARIVALSQKGRTTEITRYILNGRQILRVDQFIPETLSSQLENPTGSGLNGKKAYDIGIISDYGHGVVTRERITHLRKQCRILLADTRKVFPWKVGGLDQAPSLNLYKDVDIISLSVPDLPALEEIPDLTDTHCIFKVGEKGVHVVAPHRSSITHIPGHDRFLVLNPLGAGDAFLAALGWTLGEGKPLIQGCKRGNYIAGAACGRLGCGFISKEDIETAWETWK